MLGVPICGYVDVRPIVEGEAVMLVVKAVLVVALGSCRLFSALFCHRALVLPIGVILCYYGALFRTFVMLSRPCSALGYEN
jgi:hypothetical protein